MEIFIIFWKSDTFKVGDGRDLMEHGKKIQREKDTRETVNYVDKKCTFIPDLLKGCAIFVDEFLLSIFQKKRVSFYSLSSKL